MPLPEHGAAYITCDPGNCRVPRHSSAQKPNGGRHVHHPGRSTGRLGPGSCRACRGSGAASIRLVPALAAV
ncbi:hypothetical protein B8W90_11030, partial [Staphylococcus hominis]